MIRAKSRFIFVLLTLLSLTILSLGVMVAAAQDDQHGEEDPHWEYEGEAGPEAWGSLSHKYEMCGIGQAQSPINIEGAQTIDLANLEFSYGESALNIHNTGHSIQVEIDEGSTITYNEIVYPLKQFHLHTPSEHTINGEYYPMEAHFVHQLENGSLAVVGVLFYPADEDNQQFAMVFDNLPIEVAKPQPTDIRFAVESLLPANRQYTTYIGSLTTPPCTQGVRWLVLSEPIPLSENQYNAFRAVIEYNSRPTQPLNTRDLLEDAQ